MAESLSNDEKKFIKEEKSELLKIFKEVTHAAQQKLQQYNPLPSDREYTKYFNTLQIQFVRSVVKIRERYNVRDCWQCAILNYEKHPSFWKLAVDPLHPQIYIDQQLMSKVDSRYLSFSIGFSKDNIETVIDSLDIFDAPTIAVEISTFAESHLLVTLEMGRTIYQYGGVSYAWEKGHDSQLILEAVPLLTLIPHFRSVVYAVGKAAELKVTNRSIDEPGFNRNKSIASPAWRSDLWSEQHRVLDQAFQCGSFDFSQCDNAVEVELDKQIQGMQALIQQYKCGVQSLSAKGAMSYQEYQDATRKNTAIAESVKAFFNPLKRKLEIGIQENKERAKKRANFAQSTNLN